MAEVGGCGKDTTNSKYTLQGVPEQMSMRHFFLGDLVLLFWIVAWGRPYGFSDFVRELSSRLSLHLMLVTVSKSVRGMYVSKFKKVFMVAHHLELKVICKTLYGKPIFAIIKSL